MNDMDHMRISGIESLSVILCKRKYMHCKTSKDDDKISWNYLKFIRRESAHSLIRKLNPSVKFHGQMVYFCAKTNQFYSNLSRGGPPDPSSTHSKIFWHCVEHKRRNKDVQTKHSHKNLLNPITAPNPFASFAIFCLLKFKVGGSDPPGKNSRSAHEFPTCCLS